jgi:hypothetical protein
VGLSLEKLMGLGEGVEVGLEAAVGVVAGLLDFLQAFAVISQEVADGFQAILGGGEKLLAGVLEGVGRRRL